jgi:hypothetical protein
MGIFEKGWENPSPIQEVLFKLYYKQYFDKIYKKI